MRITNKIMQRNNLSNINMNKVYQDKLSTQMSTQKKVSRPSDDPVVAIRALRLRSSVTEVTQYYSKNIPDAESWLKVTEDGLKNLTGILTSMITQCNKGSNGDLKTSDREIILEQLKALSDEVYSTSDADYAGRYVFTGYRTDTSMTFQEKTTQKFSITEQLETGAIDKVVRMNTDKLLDWNDSNYDDASMNGVDANAISKSEVYRIRLAYNDCTNEIPTISFQQPNGRVNQDGTPLYDEVEWGNNEITLKHQHESPHLVVDGDPNAIVYVPETGELLLGQNRYETLMSVKDHASTEKHEGEIRVSYEKENWQNGDLRPQHYFSCESEGIEYNKGYLEDRPERQIIEYDVGFNQRIRVNSVADECFQHAIGREADDLIASMKEVLDLEKVRTQIENKMAQESGANLELLRKQYEAADKAYTLAKDKCQKLFESGITTFQTHLDAANLSITDCGTRSSKLELVKNRMQNQKTTFETLKSENEDVDITEVAIQLGSAQLTYEAALMATGKVVQTTLLNFI